MLFPEQFFQFENKIKDDTSIIGFDWMWSSGRFVNCITVSLCVTKWYSQAVDKNTK